MCTPLRTECSWRNPPPLPERRGGSAGRGSGCRISTKNSGRTRLRTLSLLPRSVSLSLRCFQSIFWHSGFRTLSSWCGWSLEKPCHGRLGLGLWQLGVESLKKHIGKLDTWNKIFHMKLLNVMLQENYLRMNYAIKYFSSQLYWETIPSIEALGI